MSFIGLAGVAELAGVCGDMGTDSF
jgi:hypothetical protein